MRNETKANIFLVVAFLICMAALVMTVIVPPAQSQTLPAVTMIWTAPGDDGAVGRASTYQLRYSRSAPVDTLSWWTTALPAPVPTPSVSGAADSTRISLGAWDMTYYFILRACDDGLPGPNGSTTPGPVNCSGWSNVAVVLTGPAPAVADTLPPRRTTDLRKR